MEPIRPGVAGGRGAPAANEGNMENVCVIGLHPPELQWLRLVIGLLRHPDPVVGEVAREALRYLDDLATRANQSRAAG
jgi:hypothetical protein